MNIHRQIVDKVMQGHLQDKFFAWMLKVDKDGENDENIRKDEAPSHLHGYVNNQNCHIGERRKLTKKPL